ncbi:MAG: hypothetical protein REI12_12735 [Pedobacter sp.]|nr:hypothetical protein [Pedobacter sp.]
MRIDIRTAGLASHAEPRARLAAQLMAAFKFEARISAWDGTRCHVLIADADDAYGARCIEQAARRGISVLALSQNGNSGPETVSKTEASVPAAILARQLAAMLEEKNNQSSPAIAGNGLVMLAMVPTLGSGIFTAQLKQHRIIINRQTSRVYARTQEELLAAQNDLGLPNWDFSPSTASELASTCQYSMALDAFCVLSALQGIGRFPDLPEKHYTLSDWPDLGLAVDVPNIFNLIRLLQKTPVTATEATAKSGMDALEATALLWALNASGVLVEGSAAAIPIAAPRSEKSPPELSFLNKLMQRFGLKNNKQESVS